jgi:DnaJ-class molecular chaperone
MKNLYDILGVDKSADDGEVKRAYRRRAMELHPDKTGGNKKKTNEFKEVCAAYGILGDSTRRRQYDLEGRESPDKPSIFGPLFDDLVGRIKSDGIGTHNFDDILKGLVSVVYDVKTNLPKRVNKSVEEKGGLFGFVEQIFDAALKEEAETQNAKNADEMSGRSKRR